MMRNAIKLKIFFFIKLSTICVNIECLPRRFYFKMILYGMRIERFTEEIIRTKLFTRKLFLGELR